MGAKTIQVSTDGTNYYTLPGQTGEWDDTLGTLDDTIFGYNYKSEQPGLIDATLTADAFYKGFAGYNATVKIIGTSTAMSAQATTNISGTLYQVTTAKQVWDRTVDLIVKDGATDVTEHVVSFDYLFGTVDMGSYTVVTGITITGNYFPMAALAKYRSFTLTQSASMIETTDLPTAQTNSGIRTYSQGLKTVTLQLDGVYDFSTPQYRPYIVNRSEVIIELCPDGGGITLARGFFKPTSRKQSGKVGELELETVTFDLFVPASILVSQVNGANTLNLKTPFNWQFTESNANSLTTAVQEVLNSFLNGTSLYVKYLPDGGTTSGAGLAAAAAFVSDCSLSGGYDSMNMFTVKMNISGAVTTV